MSGDASRPSLRAGLRAARDAPRGVARALLNRLDAPVVILAYHSVADVPEDPFSLAVHPDRFQAHIRFLRSRHPVLRLDENLGGARDPSVVVTFDDGYADNAAIALPILEEEKVPATFFVTTGYVASGRSFWWDELASIVFEGQDGEKRVSRLHALHRELKRLDPAAREQRLARLRGAGGAAPPGGRLTPESHRPLTRDELLRISESSIASVGAHGVRHPSFAALPPEGQREEMERSKRDLEAWTGRPVTSFSFPFGERGDFTRASIRLAAEVGFRRVAVNIPGQVHRWTSPMRLPRHVVRDWPGARFESELRRFWTR